MGPPEIAPKPVDWACLSLPKSSSNITIRVSNHEVFLPDGLDVLPAFASQEECLAVLTEVDKIEQYVWEGFEQRRKVWRWTRHDPELPASLQALAERVERTCSKLDTISVEEYPETQLQKHFTTSRSMVTTFESTMTCSCSDNDCSCSVALLPIASSLIETINRPKKRSADCWELFSLRNHATGIILDRQSLFVKTKEYLWEWRSRISNALEPPLESGKDAVIGRHVVVKFSRLSTTSTTTTITSTSTENGNSGSTSPKDSEFGYIPTPQDLLPRSEEMPPLDELLTIIVTTSPIRSNPSTELLERVFATFFHGGKDFAIRCRKVIVCDGCREKSDAVSKRHTTSKQAMRNGIVDSTQLENYNAFKAALKELCASAPDTSPFYNTHVEELQERQGYGFALRHALQSIQTPFCIVIQHDRTFMRTTPIYETVRTMWHHRNIKYVGMSMRSNLMYRDIFLGKYGRSYMDEMTACTLRPPELALDASLYGPDSESFHSMDYAGQEKLRENILALAETYQTSQQNMDFLEWKKFHSLPADKSQCSLTPTFFWYDNVHICETAHYRDFVFKPSYKMVVKGGFVEDKLSPVIKKTVERLGLSQGPYL